MKKIFFIMNLLVISLFLGSCSLLSSDSGSNSNQTNNTQSTILTLNVLGNIPNITNGSIIVNVFEYDPNVADLPATNILNKQFEITHNAGITTTKTLNISANIKPDKQYYAIVEVKDNKTNKTYRAEKTNDPMGKIFGKTKEIPLFIVK